MSWAEPAAVTAINTMANNSMAPVSPNTVEAAVGATRSLLISLGVSDTPNAMAETYCGGDGKGYRELSYAPQ